MNLTYGSVCSGIEAASVAWGPMGFNCEWLAQYDPENDYSIGLDFPSSVLQDRHPNSANLLDMTNLPGFVREGLIAAPDILIGGTPCQAFSTTGQRESLNDERGMLSLVFIELANEIDTKRKALGKNPCVILWENVPGVLNTHDNAFGHFLGKLAGESSQLQPPGKRWSNAGCVFGPQRTIAWRTLDAQFFGLAQRRRRVFVCATGRHFGCNFSPAGTLFEWKGSRRDSSPRGKTPKGSTGNIVESVTGSVSHTLKGEGADGSEDGTGRGVPIIAFNWNAQVDQMRFDPELSSPLTCSQQSAVAYSVRLANTSSNGWGIQTNVSHTLDCASPPAVSSGATVRRLTPRECERLQGFPDDYTLVPHRKNPREKCKDGPRYKAIGNSMPVPVIRWLGQRIKQGLEW